MEQPWNRPWQTRQYDEAFASTDKAPVIDPECARRDDELALKKRGLKEIWCLSTRTRVIVPWYKLIPIESLLNIENKIDDFTISQTSISSIFHATNRSQT